MITLRTHPAVLVLIAVAPGFWLLRGLARADRTNREQGAFGTLSAVARHAKVQQQPNMLGALGVLATFAETEPILSEKNSCVPYSC